MDKVKILIIFLFICCGIVGLYYVFNNSYDLIINGDLILHNDGKEFTRYIENDKAIQKKYKGYIDNNYEKNLKFAMDNGNLVLYKNSAEYDYTNSVLYSGKVKIDLINNEKLDFESSDYTTLYQILNDKGIDTNFVIGNDYKYLIDLDGDNELEQLCFSSNFSYFGIDKVITTYYNLVYLVDSDGYTILDMNTSNSQEGDVSILLSSFKINNVPTFALKKVSFSETNYCYTMYTYDTNLNELFSDCQEG